VTTAASGQLKLATSGTPKLIGGIDMTVNLPAGMIVDSDPATGETATGAVTISGPAALGNNLIMAKLTPASNGAPAQLHIVLVSADGVNLGEFATVRFNQAGGAVSPALNVFTVANFTAKGLDGSTLSGVTSALLSAETAGDKTANKSLIVIKAPPPNDYATIMLDTPTKNSDQIISGTVLPGMDLDLIVSTSSHTAGIVSGLTVSTNGFWTAHIGGLTEGMNSITCSSYNTNTTGGGVGVVTGLIVVDTTSPNLTIDTTYGTKNSFKSIGGSVDDLYNDLFHLVTVTVHCSPAYADMVTVAGTTWSAMIHDLSYGDNHCTVTASDLAGNQTSKEAHIYYDNISPSLDIHVNALAKYNTVQYVYGTVESGVIPTVMASNSAVVSAVTVTGSSWSTYISGLKEGDNIITVTAADLYGNIITKTATISVYVCNGSFAGAAHPAVNDALKALRIAVGLDIPLAEDLIRGDLFDDGLHQIDLADAILILKNAIGLFDNSLSFNNLYPQLLY
jgi:hypothetical protein